MLARCIFPLLAAACFVRAADPVVGPPQPEAAPTLQFSVRFDSTVQNEPYSGRVYVIIGDAGGDEPRFAIDNWFRPPQIFSKDVERHDGGTPVIIDHTALWYPRQIHELNPGEYRIQAVARRNLDHSVAGQGPGDLYSVALTQPLDPSGEPVDLILSKVVAEIPFEESSGVKVVELESSLLSKFHNRKVMMRAGVVLPAAWTDDPSIRHPVLYMVPGFGGDHRMARAVARMRQADSLGHQVLFVVPDPTCFHGHSVFADSANNGPWGRALLEELIPFVEKKFHGAGVGRHRYVTGVSSGGWSALWLQITYPDAFNGCWSHCPDPVDFRDFQRIDLYAEGSNIFVDDQGQPRPLARRGDNVLISYRDFVKREEVLGPGGQIRSFSAVFSGRGEDGRPLNFFDPETGAVNLSVTKTWEAFDIRLILERNWPTLGAKLAGKLHVYAGEKDTFYLERAVALLKESLTRLGSDAEVIIVPDMGHSLYRPSVEPMYQTILKNFKEQ